MADQDDFTFDEEESDSEEWYEEEEPKANKKGGGSRSRLLLLLLLLVVIAGGAYYYFMILPMDEGPAAPPKAVVKVNKKPVAMPAPHPEAKPMPAPIPAEKTAETAPAKMPVAAPKPAAPVTAPNPAPVPAPEKIATTPAKPAESVKPVESAKDVFEKPAETMPAPAVTGAFTLTAGTYLLDSSIKSVSKKIRALGYEPVLTPVKRKITMTRLKLGTYPLDEAATQLARLKAEDPDAFGIRNGNMESVYAGSYLIIDQARRFADKLYAKGIDLSEEPVEVVKTLQRVSFGSFADNASAGAAARQAKAKGVEAQVMKNK